LLTPTPARIASRITLSALPVLLVCAQATAAPHAISYRWPAGKTLRYKISAAITGKLPPFDNMEAAVDLVYAATAKSRNADGNYPVSFRVVSAEAEVAKIPFTVPEDQARKVLDQSVVLTASGDVVSIADSPPIPFSVSIPGIDLKQLHTLIVPVVFPGRPLQAGDTWTFHSALLGKDGSSPYKATLVSIDRQPGANGTVASLVATVRTEFAMDVDQKLGKDKKPAATPDDVVRTRKGKIVGSGTFRFDVGRGRLSRGEVKVAAEIAEDVVGALDTPDEPRHVDSAINAVITVAPDASKPAAAKPKKASASSKS
jgi:hypothetical protein